jgi:hypothetical protein
VQACRPSAGPIQNSPAIMKSQIIKSFLLSCALVALPSAFAGKGTEIQIPLADGTNIVVHYVEMFQTTSMGGLYPDGAENDRRFALEGVIRKSFEDAGLKVNIEVVDAGSRKSGDLDLTITMNEWDLNTMGEYECRLSATVFNGEMKINLGIYVGRNNQIVGSSNQARKAYDKAAQKAVDQMVAHFFRA